MSEYFSKLQRYTSYLQIVTISFYRTLINLHDISYEKASVALTLSTSKVHFYVFQPIIRNI